jgi:hypothetical protein
MMKQTLLILITLLISTIITQSTFASVSDSKLSVQTFFSFKGEGRNMMANTENQIPTQSEEWTELVPEKNGVMVLGKVAGRTNDTVTLDMMVIDTNKDPSEGISRPQVQAKIGEKAEIGIEGEDNFKIAVWANPIKE